MIFKYKGGYGGNYTIKFCIKMWGIKEGTSIYLDQEYKKLKQIINKVK